ncbi:MULTISPECIES: class I SAM-dependent methyltransferase [unclassified Halomonas]|uniref:class I SAM-dependent methyltransferase n=1 Tax=unclassified Halomonas TaxID=2609666 RepID=UPI001C98A231|nr:MULTISPECIES: class I SAM-dependent methyltransferase [unclassified Halomonas]MBY5924890.1 hypothetical protein [Halomonas sp. DP4Y7-2]MBY6231932.1 hypothetical protein [Halomonas sp. DP4Y7-1]
MTQYVQDIAAEGASQAPAQVLIPQLSLQSMFWRPKFTSDSSWQVHLPAAFWLVEAHLPQRVVELGTDDGASWFAWCQAVERLVPFAECLAFSATEPALEVLEYTETQYQEFAAIEQASQLQALAAVAEGSVDLLHIAPGVARFVAREWEQWKARLSSHGLVVISQAGRNQPGEALFRELAEQYPNFRFDQGQGLGLVAVGTKHSETIQRLCQFKAREQSTRLIQQVFQRLGLACCGTNGSGIGTGAASSARLREVERSVETLCQERDLLLQEKAALEADREQRFDELSQLTMLMEQAEAQRDEQARAGEDKQRELAKMTLRLEQMAAELAKANQKAAQTDHLQEQLIRLQVQQKTAEQGKQALEATNSRLKQELEAKDREFTALKAQGKEHDKQHQSQLAQARQRVTELEERLAGAQSDCAQARERNLKLESEKRLVERSHQALQQQLDDRFEELAELTRMLEEQNAGSPEPKPAQEPRGFRSAFPAFPPLSGKSRGAKARQLKEDLKLVKASGLFDSQWYLAQNPDVKDSGIPAIEHFVRFGGQEGRSPSERFDTQWYLNEYPDVVDSNINPLVHYLRFGRQEQRLPMPSAQQG